MVDSKHPCFSWCKTDSSQFLFLYRGEQRWDWRGNWAATPSPRWTKNTDPGSLTLLRTWSMDYLNDRSMDPRYRPLKKKKKKQTWQHDLTYHLNGLITRVGDYSTAKDYRLFCCTIKQLLQLCFCIFIFAISLANTKTVRCF